MDEIMRKSGWGGRIRTSGWRNQNPVIGLAKLLKINVLTTAIHTTCAGFCAAYRWRAALVCAAIGLAGCQPEPDIYKSNASVEVREKWLFDKLGKPVIKITQLAEFDDCKYFAAYGFTARGLFIDTYFVRCHDVYGKTITSGEHFIGNVTGEAQ